MGTGKLPVLQKAKQKPPDSHRAASIRIEYCRHDQRPTQCVVVVVVVLNGFAFIAGTLYRPINGNQLPVLPEDSGGLKSARRNVHRFARADRYTGLRGGPWER